MGKDILKKSEEMKLQQIKFEKERVSIQKNEILHCEQEKKSKFEQEYAAKMNILQKEYAQIAKSCKVYEESMQNELNRKKREMEQMFVKKMDILKKRIYKEVRDEMQSEMDKECMKMYKMQERAQSDFGKLNVLKADNEKQMSEIHALKMKMIENNQK